MQARWTAYLGQVQTRAVSSIVVIPVHVQDLLALDGEQSGEDTLGQASAEHDNLGYKVSALIGTLDTRARTSYSSSMVVQRDACRSLEKERRGQ